MTENFLQITLKYRFWGSENNFFSGKAFPRTPIASFLCIDIITLETLEYSLLPLTNKAHLQYYY